jgi:ER membrane protein complex subunit 10
VNIDTFPDNCESIDPAEIDLLYEFNSVAILKKPEIAPVPDTNSFISKMEKEREARDRGETKDNRSFLSKYWMYIIPAVVLLLISGITNPEAQEGGARAQN